MMQRTALRQAQGFIAEHCVCIAGHRVGQAGAHDITAADRRFSGDLGGLARELKVGDLQVEMLFGSKRHQMSNRGRTPGMHAFFACCGSTRCDSLRMCRTPLSFPS